MYARGARGTRGTYFATWRVSCRIWIVLSNHINIAGALDTTWGWGFTAAALQPLRRGLCGAYVDTALKIGTAGGIWL